MKAALLRRRFISYAATTLLVVIAVGWWLAEQSRQDSDELIELPHVVHHDVTDGAVKASGGESIIATTHTPVSLPELADAALPNGNRGEPEHIKLYDTAILGLHNIAANSIASKAPLSQRERSEMRSLLMQLRQSIEPHINDANISSKYFEIAAIIDRLERNADSSQQDIYVLEKLTAGYLALSAEINRVDPDGVDEIPQAPIELQSAAESSAVPDMVADVPDYFK